MQRMCVISVAVFTVVLLAGPGYSQVFAPDANATTGAISMGEGQALYGTFGLDAANNPNHSYSIYRKFQPAANFPEPLEIHTAQNVPGNPSTIEWTGLHQGGPGFNDSGFLAPGVYIGNSTSTSSYASQLVNFGPVIDGESSTGAVADGTDSEGRRDWDVRFAFLEDPAGFVDRRLPNNGTWDLWDGNWGTDGVMFHFGIGANIDEDPTTESTDWYVYPRELLNSLSAQSGDTDTLITTESQRDPIEFTAQRAGSGASLETENQERNTTGVSYEDRLEVSWNMELNDPTNANPILAREVKITAKVGNVVFEGMFDPGSPTDPVEPNPAADSGITYTGGWFDWQQAVPAMYIGASNQTAANATAIQGIFIPGDFDSNGIVEAADRDILNSYLGQTDTSYSRGDLDQDGDTDADDLAAWDALGGGGRTGDFNQNGELDSGDIDDLTVKSASRTNPADYDLNADTLVNDADVNFWIRDLFHSWVGDADLNREFNSSDLVVVLASGTYEADMAAVWTTGDFNGDGRTNSSDLVAALADGGYEAGPRPATAAVPEPATAVLILCAALTCLFIARP